MDSWTDEALLRRAGDGDADAFALLVRRHHRAIVRFTYRFLAARNRDAAEDLAQHVFLEAWKRAADFEPRAAVTTWLFRIATNACLNHRRSMALRRTTPLDRIPAASEPTAAPSTEDDERSERVRAAIAALPANQRAAILLRHYHDFSYTQIAEMLETSASAVDALLHRARAELRVRLAESQKFPNSPQVSTPPRAKPD